MAKRPKESAGPAGGNDGEVLKGHPPEYLRDLRKVYKTGSKDGTDGGLTDSQRVLWDLFRADPEKFVSRYHAAEKDFLGVIEKHRREAAGREERQAAAAARVVGAGKVATGDRPDAGSAKALALLEEWLARYDGGDTCSTCGKPTGGR